jgi:hypothetical protein
MTHVRPGSGRTPDGVGLAGPQASAVNTQLNEAEIALHNGDAAPRFDIWSHNDPVTLFGAAFSGTGWAEIGPLFERLGSSFSNCTSYQNDVIAAVASGDLASNVAFEHTTASLQGAPPRSPSRVSLLSARAH